MDWKRSSANATRRVRMRRSCAGVTSWPPVVARSFQLSGYRSTGTPKRGTLARANEVLLVLLPKLVDVGEVWTTLRAMTWLELVALPGLTPRQAVITAPPLRQVRQARHPAR